MSSNFANHKCTSNFSLKGNNLSLLLPEMITLLKITNAELYTDSSERNKNTCFCINQDHLKYKAVSH